MLTCPRCRSPLWGGHVCPRAPIRDRLDFAEMFETYDRMERRLETERRRTSREVLRLVKGGTS